MTLTTIIVLVLALFVVQLFLQETSRYRFDLAAIVGSRDEAPDFSKISARLDRAKNNMMEALPLFLGLTLLARVQQGDAGPAVLPALVFLVARVLYIPAYLSGLPWLRSVVWLVGMGALGMIGLSLI